MEKTYNIQLVNFAPAHTAGRSGKLSVPPGRGTESRHDPGSFSKVLGKQTVKHDSATGKDGHQQVDSAAQAATGQGPRAQTEHPSGSQENYHSGDERGAMPAQASTDADKQNLPLTPASSQPLQDIETLANLPQALSQQLLGLLKPAGLPVISVVASESGEPGMLVNELESLSIPLTDLLPGENNLDTVDQLIGQQLAVQLLQDSPGHHRQPVPGLGLTHGLPDMASMVANQAVLPAVPLIINEEISAGSNLALNIRAVNLNANERLLQTPLSLASHLINADDDAVPTTLREAVQALQFTGMSQQHTGQRSVFGSLLTDTANTPRSGGNAEINSLFSPLGVSGINGESNNISGSARMVLNVPVNQPGWDQALGNRILWMVNRNVQVAEIKLNPPQLGPLEVRITVANDQTNVTFVANNSVTREMLDAAIPRLREMFGEQGMDLVDVNVSEHSLARQEQHETGDPQGSEHNRRNDDGSDDTPSELQPMAHHANMLPGMLDTYA